MKLTKLTNLVLGTAVLMPLNITAQNRPVEYEVNRLDGASASRFASVPNEIIVKFKSSSGVSIKAQKRARFRSSSVRAVDKAFASIGVNEVEELMPLTGAKAHPRLAKGFNGKTVEAPKMDKVYRISFKEGNNKNIFEALQALKEIDDVEFAEPNYIVHSLATDITSPDDPYYSMQYGINDLNLPQLWNKPLISDKSPIIAILDTGVDIEHPDLKANIWVNEKEADGSKDYDDDRNGFADDLHGWDFVNNTGVINDYNGHGTHCAGIAAACGNNGIGIIGANPDARILPLTVLQSTGQGDVATIIKAIDYATANGADIISMSLGTYSDSAALQQALGRAYQNSVIVAAAGNDALCLTHQHPEKGQMLPFPMFPAAYNFVLGVQASTNYGGLASFSNYDDDGGFFTQYPEDKLYNYEITAPGVAIMSTYPGGGYKQLNGTSMATPLVAGAVSRLLQAKEYDSKEVLFGDLINSVTAKGNLDIAAAYDISEENRTPSLSLIGYRLDDVKMGDGDGRPDAGETIRIYPKFRNNWGTAKNIRYSLALAELEDPNTVEFIDQGEILAISNLSSYATIEGETPILVKFGDDVVDGREIRMVLTATCDNMDSPLSQELVFTVENGVEIGGVIASDMTLTAGKNYIVTNTLAIPENVTLTIEPGVVLKFRDGAGIKVSTDSNPGKIVAIGTKENVITFTSDGTPFTKNNIYSFGYSSLEYCKFINFNVINYSKLTISYGGPVGYEYAFKNCEIKNCEIFGLTVNNLNTNHKDLKCNYINLYTCTPKEIIINGDKSNYINIKDPEFFNSVYYKSFYELGNNNIFSNSEDTDVNSNIINFEFYENSPKKFTPSNPQYFGTGCHDLAKSRIYDINKGFMYGDFDVSTMLTRPVHDAHGIVWKVVVNGYDAQDEFNQLPPLGVGRHKFEVYFNRKMNHEVAPAISMGVRAPYTQTAIAEDGTWRTETFDGEEVDIYIAYLTINGRSNYDGLNRIYVDDAQDDEFFEIPYENTRFNVNVQAAGSLSDGFTAEAGLGRVNLEWDNSEENFDDMLGYNMYRYSVDDTGLVSDTIRINTHILEADQTKLTDYDVVPGKTYCYYYKVMRTDMSENSPSKTVAVTPMTSIAGDANGSAKVDVADVITTVNYASGLKPEPFIFEAADVNTDQEINILDIVGIIRIILNHTESLVANMESEATFFVDNGMLYLDTPVELAGVQFGLKLDKCNKVTATETLAGFEQNGAWISDEDYIFMAYSLSGKTIPAGLHPILNIGDAKISDVTLSDIQGRNVEAKAGATSGIADPMADWNVDEKVKGIYNILGVKLADDAKDIEKLPAGIYIVNGCKIVKK